MSIIIATILVTTVLNVALLIYGVRRLSAYLQRNSEVRDKVVEHVLLPLVGRKREQPVEEKASDD